MITDFVVKIASRCNLNCSYCYEYNLGDDSWKSQPKFMSLENFSLLCDRILENNDGSSESVHIGFHGGEPLLVGASRLSKYLEIINKRLRPYMKCTIGIQTNGVLVTEQFIDIFKEFDVNVSLSLDGYRSVNDMARLDHKGRSSFDATMSGLELLMNRLPDNFNGVLSVIDLRASPVKVYDFFRSIGLESFDFLLPDGNWANPPIRYQVDRPEYGEWLFEIYKQWMTENDPKVSVRLLESIIRQNFGGGSLFESMTTEEVNLMTISTDGEYQGLDCLKSVPLKLYQTSKYVSSDTIRSATSSPVIAARLSGTEQLSEKCKRCNVKQVCAGGYFPHRFSFENTFNNPSVYCSDLFFLCDSIIQDLNHRAITTNSKTI